MSETLMQAMHTMCMGKDPVRTKQDLLQFLKSQKTVQYQDKIQPIVQDWQKGLPQIGGEQDIPVFFLKENKVCYSFVIYYSR